MSNHRRRLHTLARELRRREWADLVKLATGAGAPYGITAEAGIAEMSRIMGLPEADQRAHFATLYTEADESTSSALDDLRAKYRRILLGHHDR